MESVSVGRIDSTSGARCGQAPGSEALSAAVVEYVAHFCGVDCYEEWMESKRTEELKTVGE